MSAVTNKRYKELLMVMLLTWGVAMRVGTAGMAIMTSCLM
jgi:hypothetical protein